MDKEKKKKINTIRKDFSRNICSIYIRVNFQSKNHLQNSNNHETLRMLQSS